MAKILISNYSAVKEKGDLVLTPLYEGLIETLVKNGNQVLHMFSNEFVVKPWNGSNKSPFFINKKSVRKKIIDFNPDLVIAFNNSIFKDVPEILDCPIAIWDADSVYHFNDIDYIKKNVSKYHFLCLSEDTIDAAKKLFLASSKQVSLLRSATAFINEDKNFTRNINFIGTCFKNETLFKGLLEAYGVQKVQKLLRALKNNYYSDFKEILKKSEINFKTLAFSEAEIKGIYSPEKRLKSLSAVSNLGLEIFGTENWASVGLFTDLILSYNPQKVYSMKHNQDIYNSSKISFNISHTQAVRAFPWRVYDIMATNSCLVSNYNPTIDRIFSKYVKIPMYETPGEAREICQKILKDELWRKEIVLGSQKAIEETGRFEHRMKDLEGIFGINLFPKKEGNMETLNHKEHMIAVTKPYFIVGRTLIRIMPLFIYHALSKMPFLKKSSALKAFKEDADKTFLNKKRKKISLL